MKLGLSMVLLALCAGPAEAYPVSMKDARGEIAEFAADAGGRHWSSDCTRLTPITVSCRITYEGIPWYYSGVKFTATGSVLDRVRVGLRHHRIVTIPMAYLIMQL